MSGDETYTHSVSILISVPKGSKGEKLIKLLTGIVKIGAFLLMGAKKINISATNDLNQDNNPDTDDYLVLFTW
jgi:hypothetical protein